MPSDLTIVQRNRQNGRQSTSPRSARGKSIARRNSLRHGLCANPAAKVIENSRLFNKLHTSLIDQLGPADVIEHGLVHRIAVCFWRIQRSARIDAAIGDLAVNALHSQHEETQKWIQRINDAWRIEVVPADDETFQQDAAQSMQPNLPYVPIRPELRTLDHVRERTMMGSAAALAAMAVMVEDLTERLERFPEAFLPAEAEKLAWLLGDHAASFPLIDPSSTPACPMGHRSSALRLIAQIHGQSDAGNFLPPLKRWVDNRLLTLRQQRRVIEDPDAAELDEQRRTIQLLPEEKILDRLIRYESHAERSLQRALELLARQRSVSVQLLATAITHRMTSETNHSLQ